MRFYSFLLMGSLGLLNACDATPGMNPRPSSVPSAMPSASIQPSPQPSASSDPSLVAPPGEVQILQYAHCEAGSVWIVPKGEQIAVAPCLPPESQPAYLQPAASIQIPENEHPALAERFGFLGVGEAPAKLGSLRPAGALADGLKGQCEPADGVVFHGGLLGSCSQYLWQKPNEAVQVLKTQSEMRAVFAPIESHEEAASYALALSGAQWRADFAELSPDFRFYTRVILRSRVDQVAEGYEVLLYQPQRFGCGPHPVFAMTYFVSSGGDFQLRNSEQVWANPALDGLCVD